MALVSIWSLDPIRGWIVKLVDHESLRPRTPDNYWMYKAMDRSPSASLNPPWFHPPVPKPPPRRPGTDYKRMVRLMQAQAKHFAYEEELSRQWVAERNAQLKHEMRELVARVEKRHAQRPHGNDLADFALSLLSDHDYISAMFAHYSSGHCRLLQ